VLLNTDPLAAERRPALSLARLQAAIVLQAS
jgi:hypothetical protein